METHKARLLGWLVFCCGAFVGPLIRWLTWPPSAPHAGLGLESQHFIYDLVLLLWPGQILGPLEYSVGIPLATVVTVGANVLVYAAVGWGIVLSSRNAVTFWPSVCAVCFAAYMFRFGAWGMSLSLSWGQVLALLLAFSYYILLSLLVRRIATGLGTARLGAKS